ncbi:MAG: hypothetical protein R3F34_02700 [Planctomycetota bacterium]
MSLPRSITAFVERFGEAVSGLFLTVVYFAVLGPLALVVRLFGDPLKLDARGSAWTPWPSARNAVGRPAVERARRQG